MILSLILIAFISAQEEIPDPNKVIKEDNSITLLGSTAYPCSDFEQEKKCEKNLVYDKGSDELHVFLSDGRDKESGEMDINAIFRDPASYGGEMTSHSIRDLFSLSNEKILNLNAQLKKNNDINIQIVVGEKTFQKTIKGKEDK